MTPPSPPLEKVREKAQQPKSFTSSKHKVKGFADDFTIISRSLNSHQQVLSETATKCEDLDLHVRPDKCVSILFNGKKMLEDSTIQLPTGRTNNIRNAPTKFLGGYIGHTRQASTRAASSRLTKTVLSALVEFDHQPIRGEYKCWLRKHYLPPSLHFYLAVDDILKTGINQLQSKINKQIKKWLHLPRSTTLASIYHPSVLALPFFPHFHLKAKVDYLVAISTSQDPVLRELVSTLSEQNLPQSVPPSAMDPNQLVNLSRPSPW